MKIFTFRLISFNLYYHYFFQQIIIESCIKSQVKIYFTVSMNMYSHIKATTIQGSESKI